MDSRLLTAIQTYDGAFTKREARIAAYLSAMPEALAVETSASVAEKLGVSPMTLTRFFQKLGFDGAAAAKESLKQDLYGPRASRVASRFERFKAVRSISEEGDLMVATSALRHAFDARNAANWKDIVNLVAHADHVYVVGFQTMSYVAEGLCQRLRYIRNNVTLPDPADGIYGNLFTDPAPRKVLLMIDKFRYAAQGPLLLKAAREAGIEVVFFCDEFCDWANGTASHLVILPNEAHFFMGMPVGVNFVLNLLLQDVITELGPTVAKQIEALSHIQDKLEQYL